MGHPHESDHTTDPSNTMMMCAYSLLLVKYAINCKATHEQWASWPSNVTDNKRSIAASMATHNIHVAFATIYPGPNYKRDITR